MGANNTQLTRAERTAVWTGTAVWIGGIAASIVLTLATDRPPRWLAATTAAVAVAGLVAVAVVIGRSAMRQEGVERTVNVEASALAFWMTMGAVITYQLIDSFADVPAIRAYWVLLGGMLAWAVAHGTRLERYR
jgi:uncharacterized membrane protein YdcZ (DUF606 family)